MKILVATRNPAKLLEYSLLFKENSLELVTLPEGEVFIEEGSSFEENACRKARFYAQRSYLPVLAEDSGLEVEALGGAPGVVSARFGGEGISPYQRNKLLLERLKGVPWKKRGARFVCIIAFLQPGQEIKVFSGECLGYIAYELAGENGFGYDPIFYLPEIGKTLAQLSVEEKNRFSHRGKAFKKFIDYLKGT